MKLTGHDGSNGVRTTVFGLPINYSEIIVNKVGKPAIKKITVPQDLFAELSNHFVKTKKLTPENLYLLTHGHTVAVGIALAPHAFYPESMAEKDIELLFE